ncbi:oxygenase MpaB family protein [Cryptosporangium minutisporangium]|uniref:ER-bound oxygenase mpaB/mpaB'/Rubber oxygenase catalytic domain-containing protein n=1 Tax=Cryptosporangium minutisporangium TaxID=113569 RepID=A0ABP6T987_9ACTN
MSNFVAARVATRFERSFDTDIRSKFFRGMEFREPEGDPGWFGPDSAVWYVHSHLPTVVLGLVAAAYIEGLDPSISWMGYDHSRLVERVDGVPTGNVDPEGAAVRLGHSIAFFIGTAYGSTRTAENLARTVRAMHHTVKGVRPDGLRYDADDPDWLRWNYATVVWGLATAHERYHRSPLRGPALDRYYGEFVRVGEALGGTELPATKAEVAECLESYLPKLALTPIKAFGTGPNLRDSTVPPWQPGSAFMDWAARDMLPRWAQKLALYQPPNRATLHARRTSLWLAVNGLHRATGPLREFREAQARVAAGTVPLAAPVAVTRPAGPDPVRTRSEIEAAL